MKIMFMGTPDFAKKILKGLVDTNFDVCAAVSQPDRKCGRGHKVRMTAVREYALSANIPVYQPESLKDGGFKEILDEHRPDIIVVAAYGKILPEYIINYSKYGCINVHASLLPEYRGAAPIQRSVMDGREETGVTIMKMDKGLDTGDILYQVKTKIGKYETSGELFDRLAEIGKDALTHTLNNIDSIEPAAQDNEKATYAGMINKADAKIDWNNSAEKVSKLICAMFPSPGAFTYYNGEIIKITKAEIADNINIGENANSGDILGYEKGKGFFVKCADGILIVRMLQTAGKKSMTADDYVNGKGIMKGKFE